MANVKRKRADDSISEEYVRDTRELLRFANDFLIAISEDLDDLPEGPKTRIELRERIELVEKFAKSIEGPNFERNERWCKLVWAVRNAKKEGKAVTAVNVAAWSDLPSEYTSDPDASTLIAKAVNTSSKEEWPEHIAAAIKKVEGVVINGATLVATVSDFQRYERRMKGVSAD